MERRHVQAGDARELPHRRTVARRLYARAAVLLLAADDRTARADGSERRPAAALRAAAARLQLLAARLAAPMPVLAVVPVPVTAIGPRRRRAG